MLRHPVQLIFDVILCDGLEFWFCHDTKIFQYALDLSLFVLVKDIDRALRCQLWLVLYIIGVALNYVTKHVFCSPPRDLCGQYPMGNRWDHRFHGYDYRSLQKRLVQVRLRAQVCFCPVHRTLRTGKRLHQKEPGDTIEQPLSVWKSMKSVVKLSRQVHQKFLTDFQIASPVLGSGTSVVNWYKSHNCTMSWETIDTAL